jgi:hypothetical protein
MTGEERERLVYHWRSLGLSTRAARLLVNDGINDLAGLRSGRWFLIPRCGAKMRLEVFDLLGRMEAGKDER